MRIYCSSSKFRNPNVVRLISIRTVIRVETRGDKNLHARWIGPKRSMMKPLSHFGCNFFVRGNNNCLQNKRIDELEGRAVKVRFLWCFFNIYDIGHQAISVNGLSYIMMYMRLAWVMNQSYLDGLPGCLVLILSIMMKSSLALKILFTGTGLLWSLRYIRSVGMNLWLAKDRLSLR